MLPGAFSAHITKGTVVKEKSVTKIALCRHLTTNPTAHEFELGLLAYKGKRESVSWLDEDPGEFHQICTLSARVPAECWKRRVSASGSVHWTANFDVVVSFGTTEFEGHVEWGHAQGRIKCGPTSIVWNEG